jgi:hypothetical protein
MVFHLRPSPFKGEDRRGMGCPTLPLKGRENC